MDLSKLSEEALAEWREHPVSRLVAECLKRVLDAQKASAEASYWAGSQWSEPERLAYLRKVELWEDLFEADAEDFRNTMEMMDEL